ncbi:Efflux pump aflT [Colletotrichum fructicola]|nr:Efflux pump aflT [Colletotrichum fructicola]
MTSGSPQKRPQEESPEIDAVEWATQDVEKRFSVGFNPGHIRASICSVSSNIDGLNQAPALPEAMKPPRHMVAATVTGLLIAVLLMALDVNILATSVPKITTEFKSLRDAAWYVAAFSLARLATQPIYGQLYTLFSMKYTFCCSLATVIMGSTICAVSPNSMTLIIGRGVQGLGSSGVASGALNIGGYTVSKAKMPLMISLMGSMMMTAALAGPVLGGAFTESVLTWRFGFWLNLRCIATTCTYLAVTVLAYYMPFYLQAAKGLSPSIAGLYMLALGGPETLATIASGTLITYTKHYVPMLVLGGAVFSLGSGLLSTLTTGSNAGQIIGYEVLTSIGLGFGGQVPLTALRNVLCEADIPIANGLNGFSQSLGVVLGAPIAQSVFMNTLTSHLGSRLQPGNVTKITDLGASNINPSHIDPQLLPFVAQAYRDASTTSLYVAVASAAMASAAGLLMEWKKLKTKEEGDS